ncbi:OLC1v1012126C1 [Oldenlandia corymbosa var. corymbosa]|uniref:OLC1v1012126C1 n=1 Tax=Oldenlandia corymbosa var. corymbosa TaxID=529605 RepID=A0AAV1DVD5_OLDCO|nr:OLC1v1012126C1 [Oldenlandia corymbosa var. corymbosa]
MFIKKKHYPDRRWRISLGQEEPAQEIRAGSSCPGDSFLAGRGEGSSPPSGGGARNISPGTGRLARLPGAGLCRRRDGISPLDGSGNRHVIKCNLYTEHRREKEENLKKQKNLHPIFAPPGESVNIYDDDEFDGEEEQDEDSFESGDDVDEKDESDEYFSHEMSIVLADRTLSHPSQTSQPRSHFGAASIGPSSRPEAAATSSVSGISRRSKVSNEEINDWVVMNDVPGGPCDGDENIEAYSWGSGTLAFLHRQLEIASRPGCTTMASCMTLLQVYCDDDDDDSDTSDTEDTSKPKIRARYLIMSRRKKKEEKELKKRMKITQVNMGGVPFETRSSQPINVPEYSEDDLEEEDEDDVQNSVRMGAHHRDWPMYNLSSYPPPLFGCPRPGPGGLSFPPTPIPSSMNGILGLDLNDYKWSHGGVSDWFILERCQKADENTQASAFLWVLLASTLFMGKSGGRCSVSLVHELMAGIENMGSYSWGSVTLMFLYRQLGTSRAKCTQLGGYLTLLQAWIYKYFPCFHPQGGRVTRGGNDRPRVHDWIPPSFAGPTSVPDRLRQVRECLDRFTELEVKWEPFGLDQQEIVPRTIYSGWIMYRNLQEPYMPDRCICQIGYVQSIPRSPMSPDDAFRGPRTIQYFVEHSAVDTQYLEEIPGVSVY